MNLSACRLCVCLFFCVWPPACVDLQSGDGSADRQSFVRRAGEVILQRRHPGHRVLWVLAQNEACLWVYETYLWNWWIFSYLNVCCWTPVCRLSHYDYDIWTAVFYGSIFPFLCKRTKCFWLFMSMPRGSGCRSVLSLCSVRDFLNCVLICRTISISLGYEPNDQGSMLLLSELRGPSWK